MSGSWDKNSADVMLYGGISPAAVGLELINEALDRAGEQGHAVVGRRDPASPAVACWCCLVCERTMGFDPLTSEVWGRALTESCDGPVPMMGA